MTDIQFKAAVAAARLRRKQQDADERKATREAARAAAREEARRQKANQPPPDPGVVRGYKAAARLLGIHARTLQRWVAEDQGGIRSAVRSLAPRGAVFDVVALRCWVATYPVPAPAIAHPPQPHSSDTQSLPRLVRMAVREASEPLTLAVLHRYLHGQFEMSELSAVTARLVKAQVLERQQVSSVATTGRRTVNAFVPGPRFEVLDGRARGVRRLYDASHAGVSQPA